MAHTRLTLRDILRRILLAGTLLLVVGLAGCSYDPGSFPGSDDDATGDVASQSDSSSDDDTGVAGDADASTNGDVGPSSNDASGDTASPNVDVRIVAVDPQGRPIEEARVELGPRTGMTDAKGGVNFVGVDPSMVWVPVVRGTQFAPGTAVLRDLPDDGQITRYVTLLPAGDTRRFDASSPTQLFKDDIHVRLPADALQDADGETVSGPVHAAIASPELDGEMAAIPADSEGEPSETFGGLEVRFFKETSDGPQPLSLAADTSATVEMLVPEDHENEFDSGDALSISSYDLRTGRWARELDGTIQESSFASGRLAWQGELSHFSWWNLRREVPEDETGCLRVELTGSNTDGVSVAARGVDYNGAVRGGTGDDGTVCLPVPRDRELRVAVRADGGHAPRRKNITTTVTGAASCGESDCETVQIEMIPSTCLAGTTRDNQGAAVGNAALHATWDTGFGRIGTAARGGSDGSFCALAPHERPVTVHAAAKSRSGMTMVGSGLVEHTGSAGSCEMAEDECTAVPELGLQPTATATNCVHPADDPSCSDNGPAARITDFALAGPDDSCCKDFDGQPGGDSQLPVVLSALSLATGGDIRPADVLERQIKSGKLNLVFEFFHLESLYDDASFQLALHRAEKLNNGRYAARVQSAPNRDHPRSMLFRGDLEQRQFRADLGRLYMPFSLGFGPDAPTVDLPIEAPEMTDARLQSGGRVAAGGSLAFDGAKLAGWVRTETMAGSLNEVTKNACPCLDKQAFDPSLSCQVTSSDATSCSDSGKVICQTLSIPKTCETFATKAKKARDVDTDDDGRADAWSIGAQFNGEAVRLDSSH